MATSNGSIAVSLKGDKELMRKLQSERATPAVRRFLDRGSIYLQGRAREHAPVDQGRLRNSIGIESPNDRMRKIVPSVEYGEWVETGTRPHWPPPGALAGWAKRHGMSEYSIRRKIGMMGTQAQPYMQPAADDTEGFIPTLIPVLAAEIESAFQ